MAALLLCLMFALPLAAQTPPIPDPAASAAAPPTPPPATPPAPAAEKPKTEPPKKIITNPFTPGGATRSDQMISRDEVRKMLEDQENRLRQSLTTNVDTSEINRLIARAATGSNNLNPENFLGCVNGVPMYRSEDGILTLGTDDPEEIKMARCIR